MSAAPALSTIGMTAEKASVLAQGVSVSLAAGVNAALNNTHKRRATTRPDGTNPADSDDDLLASTGSGSPGDVMTIMPLGAGNEVGRSCIILKFKGKTIMLDCGIHPGYSGIAALPFFDEVDAEDIDLLLVTHFHLDHVASLPYFTEKTKFRGRIFMTHPTKAVMQMMLRDYVRISNIAAEDQLYTEKELNNCIQKIETIDFHQEREVAGIKFCPYNAGHVLGAAMFMIEFGGVRVLYTGDYSLEDDRHLMAAEVPTIPPDVLIVEATYGIQVHQSITEREARFTGLVESIVRRGGRCLIPSFALGRSQELLLILDEHWQAHPDLHDIPIYFASKIAAKALRVYQTYVNMMNERMRKQIAVNNPFRFQFIQNLKSLEDFDDSGPCVVMASPAMLDSGVSRDLFERWCTDKRNGCIIPGYVVEGTLAKKILSEPPEITALDGRVLPLNCKVEYISFSAHADFVQTSGFIDDVKVPPNIILVHAENNQMMRLKSSLNKKYKNRQNPPNILTPANCVEVKIVFHGEKTTKAIGSLAVRKPKDGQRVNGLLVQHDFSSHFLAPEDLQTYTQLTLSKVTQKQHIPFYQSFEVLKAFVEQMYDDVSVSEEGVESSESPADPSSSATPNKKVLTVCQNVALAYSPGKVMMQWLASPLNDMIADSLIGLMMQAQASPSSIKLTKPVKCNHNHGDEDDNKEEVEAEKKQSTEEERVVVSLTEQEEDDVNLLVIFRLLKHHFGQQCSMDTSTRIIHILTETGITAEIDFENARIHCKDEALEQRLKDLLKRIQTALYPIEFNPY